jgi:DNA-binding transcriptional LysR family regulator
VRDPQDVAWRFRRKDGIPTESTVRLSRIGTVVVGFLAGHPETSVDLRTGDVMIDLVREGFDLAIMPTSPPDSTLVKRRLAVWRYVVCAAPAYLEKHAPPQSPAYSAAIWMRPATVKR